MLQNRYLAMSNTNPQSEQEGIQQRGGRNKLNNLGLINVMANASPLTVQGRGGIAEVDSRLQSLNVVSQTLPQTNFAVPQQQIPQSTTFIQNQPQFTQAPQQFYQTIPQTMKSSGVGGILENNISVENIQSRPKTSELSKRQINQTAQAIGIDSQGVSVSDNPPTQFKKLTKQESILEAWNRLAKSPNKFERLAVNSNPHLDDKEDKPKAA